MMSFERTMLVYRRGHSPEEAAGYEVPGAQGDTTMDIASLYQSKLTMPNQAVASIPSGSKLSMGMAMAEPPALLKALADRAEAGGIEDLKVYYFEATSIAGKTILRYELMDCIRPYCMFVSATERALIKRGVENGERKIINYVPNNFHQPGCSSTKSASRHLSAPSRR